MNEAKGERRVGLDQARRLVAQAAAATVSSVFVAQARLTPARIALESDGRRLTYADLDRRANQTASILTGFGVGHGDRVAILSENRPEYIELQLACAKLGVIAACQNWRLATPELKHCLELVSPKIVVTSPRYAAKLPILGAMPVCEFGAAWEARLSRSRGEAPPCPAQLEDPLFILYTSGTTTGLPKGAVLSHRSELARVQIMPFDLKLEPGNNNLCWPPLYHMGGTEPAWHALLTGGRVVIIDGFDPDRIVAAIEAAPFPWVSFMPGTLASMIDVLERRNTKPRGIKACGVMADLSPPHEVERLAELLDADFCNCFGSTETGTPPLSGRPLPRGRASDLGKGPSILTEIRLVDGEDHDVQDGEVGELAMRGPTLFAGYWQNDDATCEDFRNGWFHMGDLFRRRPDGLYDFVDRAKYLIKSGGESIYPAEVERVLLGAPGVADAVVVRRKDDRWGEVPIALVVADNASLDLAALAAHCRSHLAGYKQPKEIRIVGSSQIMRSTTGKVQRKALETWVAETPWPVPITLDWPEKSCNSEK